MTRASTVAPRQGKGKTGAPSVPGGETWLIGHQEGSTWVATVSDRLTPGPWQPGEQHGRTAGTCLPRGGALGERPHRPQSSAQPRPERGSGLPGNWLAVDGYVEAYYTPR